MQNVPDTTFASIMHHAFDQPETKQAFAQRLAIENGWDRHYADRVLVEYRRFLFLMIKSDRHLTPSIAVDQVWHLHITNTMNYASFCANVMPNGQFLHHVPTEGGESEEEKFSLQYQTTLDRYQAFFGKAPEDIWEDPYTRFATPASAFVRINLLRNGVYKKGWSILFWVLGFPALILLGNIDFFWDYLASYAWISYLAILIFSLYIPECSFDNKVSKIDKYVPSASDGNSCNNCGGGGCGGG